MHPTWRMLERLQIMKNNEIDMKVIAERHLHARLRATGTEVAIRAVVGTPYWVEDGLEAACPVALEGLQGRLADIKGIDPIDALRNAIGIIDKLLIGALEYYDVYWSDGEAFEP